MKRPKTEALLRLACVLALVALALMTWSLFDPRPPPVLVALTLGQALGTLSFAIFLYVVASDLRRAKTDGPLGLRKDLPATSLPPTSLPPTSLPPTSLPPTSLPSTPRE